MIWNTFKLSKIRFSGYTQEETSCKTSEFFILSVTIKPFAVLPYYTVMQPRKKRYLKTCNSITTNVSYVLNFTFELLCIFCRHANAKRTMVRQILLSLCPFSSLIKAILTEFKEFKKMVPQDLAVLISFQNICLRSTIRTTYFIIL